MMDQILDQFGTMIDAVMGFAAELGPTGGILAAIAATAILVWITGRFLRIG
jgi:hypothetical protein